MRAFEDSQIQKVQNLYFPRYLLSVIHPSFKFTTYLSLKCNFPYAISSSTKLLTFCDDYPIHRAFLGNTGELVLLLNSVLFKFHRH
jgi:hypothetical protein